MLRPITYFSNSFVDFN